MPGGKLAAGVLGFFMPEKRLASDRRPIPAMCPLEVAALDFRFRARQQMRMPGYMGSAWRGGFGRALRRAVCVTGLSTCPGCPFETSCVYPYLFETADGVARHVEPFRHLLRRLPLHRTRVKTYAVNVTLRYSLPLRPQFGGRVLEWGSAGASRLCR